MPTVVVHIMHARCRNAVPSEQRSKNSTKFMAFSIEISCGFIKKIEDVFRIFIDFSLNLPGHPDHSNLAFN